MRKSEGRVLRGRNQPQNHRRRRPLNLALRIAREMEMRRAVAGPGLPRMAAERDRLTIPVPAVRVTAISRLEIIKRNQPRADPHAAQLRRLFALACRPRPNRGGRPALRTWRPAAELEFGSSLLADLRPRQSHPFGSAQYRASCVSRSKSCVNFLRDLAIRHALGMQIPQRFGVSLRPVGGLHSSPLLFAPTLQVAASPSIA